MQVQRHELTEPHPSGLHVVSGVVESGAGPGLAGAQGTRLRLVRRRKVRGHVVDRLGNPSGWAVGCDDDGDDLAYPAH